MSAIAQATVRSAGPDYRHEVTTGTHTLVADEPKHAGGEDAGPAPYDLVLAGLGACTAITLRMYAARKEWQLGEVTVELTLHKDRDGNATIDRTLRCSAPLSDEQWERLLDIAGKTPVTRSLQAGMPIATTRAG
ncbi:OsmC family protein [Cupriavidus sp. AU9028]|uniref:OsmC family protein n=1 Tax=Cupriavidus sp. AU9028 TaxID=2871157 RepID=UPI001C9694A8|nr:OsmC family protein [Cupriavidus sp. AU9028]MBY4898574.1 OsmC family protein [Cupriavidus sp. AU9028]